MKDLSMLVWLSQVGISVAAPPVVLILLALWLRNRFALGSWCVWAALILGIYCAVSGLRQSLRLMEKMSRKNGSDTPNVPGFNEHL